MKPFWNNYIFKTVLYHLVSRVSKPSDFPRIFGEFFRSPLSQLKYGEILDNSQKSSEILEWKILLRLLRHFRATNL